MNIGLKNVSSSLFGMYLRLTQRLSNFVDCMWPLVCICNREGKWLSNNFVLLGKQVSYSVTTKSTKGFLFSNFKGTVSEKKRYTSLNLSET